MTAAPVMSITDELIAELEAAANSAEGSGESWYTASSVSRFPMFEADEEVVALASPSVIRALLAERAELKRRATQGDWLIEYMASERDDLDDTLMEGCSDNRPHVLRSIIDAAMQAAQ